MRWFYCIFGAETEWQQGRQYCDDNATGITHQLRHSLWDSEANFVSEELKAASSKSDAQLWAFMIDLEFNGRWLTQDHQVNVYESYWKKTPSLRAC